jgi:hypothetical protein
MRTYERHEFLPEQLAFEPESYLYSRELFLELATRVVPPDGRIDPPKDDPDSVALPPADLKTEKI